MDRSVKPKSLEPWQVALIVLSVVTVVVILAIVVGLLIYYLAYDTKEVYYNATFKVNNVAYTPGFQKQTSAEFRDLSANIENLIHQAFERTHFRKKLIRSRVVNISADNGGVQADVVLVFRFIASDNKAALLAAVDKILLSRLKLSTWPLSIDLMSFKLSEIKPASGENLLNSCCGTRANSSGERIFGGNVVGEGEWPWQASLQLNGAHRCGATLISNSWLVTAAHCFRGFQEIHTWTTSFGARLKPPKMKRNLRQIIIHEGYANNVMNHEFDIAVVQIAPVDFTADVHPVCLPEATHVFPDNSECYVTGWGALKDEGPSVGELRETKVRIIGNQVCNRQEVYNGVITPGMLCAGYLEGGSDACQGDSGGPLVAADSRGIWYLVGIVSWGDECAKPNKPGVYTRVTYYRDWIQTQTGL